MYKILMIPRNWLLLMKFIYASVSLFEFVVYMLRYQKMLTKLQEYTKYFDDDILMPF